MISQRFLVQSLVVFLLILSSWSLFIWHFTHTPISTQPTRQTLTHLIRPVQASNIKQPLAKPSQVKQWYVKFKTRQSHLSYNEQQRIIATIQQWQLNRTSHIDIHVALFTHDHDIATPQLAKLRAQAIARLFFPHTQNINIHLKIKPNDEKDDKDNNISLIQLDMPHPNMPAHLEPQHLADAKPL